MLREIIRPQNREHTIHIPDEYIDKDIEVLILPLEDNKISKEIKERVSEYKNGTLKTLPFSQGLDEIREKITAKL